MSSGRESPALITKEGIIRRCSCESPADSQCRNQALTGVQASSIYQKTEAGQGYHEDDDLLHSAFVASWAANVVGNGDVHLRFPREEPL